MKKFLTSLLAIMLVLCMVTSASALVLRKGATGTLVVAVQQYLNNNYGANLVVDGKYGTKTMAAVRVFQSQNGLKVDGLAGPATLAAMGLDTSNPSNPTRYSVKLSMGSTNTNAVKALQQLLQRYNYRPGAVDGKFGISTYKAVMEFQQLNGLTVDGVVGTSTWDKLYSGNVVIYDIGGQTPDTNAPVQDFYDYITSCRLSNMSPLVGDTITANITPSTGKASYVWYRNTPNGKVQVGTGKTYKVTAYDLGCALSCVATGYGNTNGSAESDATAEVTEAIGGILSQQGDLVIPSIVHAKDVVTASLQNANNTNVIYTWYLDGSVYQRNTSKITAAASMVDHTLYVVAEAANDSGYTGRVVSNIAYVVQTLPDVPVIDVDNDPTTIEGAVTVTLPVSTLNTANSDQTVIANVNYGATTLNDSKVTVMWYVDGALIGTGKTCKIAKGTIGSLTVTVVANSGSGYNGSVSSAACTLN